jgi:hypothetical protein
LFRRNGQHFGQRQERTKMPEISMIEMKAKAKEMSLATLTNFDICWTILLVQRQIEVIRERLDKLEAQSAIGKAA